VAKNLCDLEVAVARVTPPNSGEGGLTNGLAEIDRNLRSPAWAGTSVELQLNGGSFGRRISDHTQTLTVSRGTGVEPDGSEP